MTRQIAKQPPMSNQDVSPVPKPMPVVLLVEDDLDIRDVLQDALEGDGLDVVPAGSGKQALDYLLGSPPPDLVLLDLMMPIVTGWQVLEVMRRTPALQSVPTIVMTAVARDRPSGAWAILRKPFDLEALLSLTRDCLNEGPKPAPKQPVSK